MKNAAISYRIIRIRDGSKLADSSNMAIFQLPSQERLQQDILPGLKKEIEVKVKGMLQTADFVAITADAWTSHTCTSFVSITAHFLSNQGQLETKLLDCTSFHVRHTAENLKERLQQVMNDHAIGDKLVAAVSDNASNVTKAIVDAGMKSKRKWVEKHLLVSPTSVRFRGSVFCPLLEFGRQRSFEG